MKVIVCLFVCLFITVSCKKVGDKKESFNMDVLKKEYGINYELPFRGEILINNILVDKDFYNRIGGFGYINNCILKNGTQSVQVNLSHPFVEKGGLIKSDVLFNINDFIIYTVLKEQGKVSALDTVKKLDFPEIQEPVPFIKYEWKFEAELPFELEGWKNSQDLTKWDEKELEKKTVSKFNELRNILNSGNGAAFVKELEFANKEYFIANYFTENQKEEYISNLIGQYGELKGLVPSIENYKMRIMGDGKVVTLERLEKYRGQGILTSENKESGDLYLIYTMLHIPKGKENFEIVRINSQMTSID